MLSDAPGYIKHRNVQRMHLQKFLPAVVKKMDWTQEALDTVMDIGCGPGDAFRTTYLPAFPNVKKMIGIDVLPDMIKHAKENNAHEKIEYEVADIADASTLERFSGKISKAISVFCFHWLKDQKTAFMNLYSLLEPGGEAAVMFVLNSNLFDIYPEIICNPKWNEYLKDIDPCIPESHTKKHEDPFYRSLLADIGFEVNICQAYKTSHAFPDDQTCADECYQVCSLAKGIPPELKEEFKEEILRGVLKHSGRNNDGKLEMKYSYIYLLVKKLN